MRSMRSRPAMVPGESFAGEQMQPRRHEHTKMKRFFSLAMASLLLVCASALMAQQPFRENEARAPIEAFFKAPSVSQSPSRRSPFSCWRSCVWHRPA